MKKHRPSPQENLPGSEHGVIAELYRRFGADAIAYQPTVDGLPTAWVPRAQLPEVLRFLRDAPRPYAMLYDLHGVDERLRTHREGLPAADFTGIVRSHENRPRHPAAVVRAACAARPCARRQS